ncbi:MAG: L-2-amino-thiazoline-4-carboxylic acid hydrolase, partial [Candidatus Lokiarchaeota archaeon]|nr:L-2-amino-thiazoline-4-carboxylic acid hydrolase [Candidatus Lokiarchaeota archaeon]
MAIISVKDYYIKQKAQLMQDFSNMTNGMRKFLARKFEDAKLDKILKQMNEEFENLIPKIPYIGGDKNLFTGTLIQDISYLAIFRILEKEGFSYREVGEFFYKLIDGEIRLDKENLEKSGKDPAQDIFEIEHINQRKSLAEESQKSTFPFDFVINFVEGGGVSFEYGLNFTECGICKLYNELGAEKYIPLICMAATRQSSIFGFGLFRTQTLMSGAPTCDYRFIKKLKAIQKITEEEVTYFKEKKICLVCKGNIKGFNNYICPKCEVLYCENCARALIDLE